MTRWSLAAVLVAGVIALGACGGSDDEGSGTSAKTDAKVIDAKAADDAQGEVTFCAGKDVTGALAESVRRFNAANPRLKAKLLEFPESADEQRNQFVQRQRAKSPECDVFASDGVWQAEFVAQNWIYDLTPYVKPRASEFIPSILDNMQVDGRYFGVQRLADAAFLYARTDQVKELGKTWQDVYELASKTDGIVYQGAAYEGLTVDFLELAYGAGGTVLSEDGKESAVDSPENLKALELMVDGIADGAAPKAVTTYMEEQARRAFEAGKATFMRNWPYAYAIGQQAPATKGKFEVAPLPEFEGGARAGVLGGQVLVVSVYSENPGGALELIDFLTSPETLRRDAVKNAWASPLKTTYEDAALRKQLPYLPQLEQAIAQARPRPVSPVYPQISEAIYKNVNAALSGEMPPKEALEQADADINKALETF